MVFFFWKGDGWVEKGLKGGEEEWVSWSIAWGVVVWWMALIRGLKMSIPNQNARDRACKRAGIWSNIKV